MSMPRKKQPFNKAEVFYVSQHMDKDSPKKIAGDLGRTEQEVKDEIAGLKANDRKKTPPLKKTMFAERDGTVAMTSAQSTADDKIPKGPNQAWMGKHAKNIFHLPKAGKKETENQRLRRENKELQDKLKSK